MILTNLQEAAPLVWAREKGRTFWAGIQELSTHTVVNLCNNYISNGWLAFLPVFTISKNSLSRNPGFREPRPRSDHDSALRRRRRKGGRGPGRAPTPPTQPRAAQTASAPGPSALPFRGQAQPRPRASGPGAAPKPTQQTPANSNANGGGGLLGRPQPSARPSPRRVAPTKGGPEQRRRPTGPWPHLPRVLLVLAGVDLVALGAVVVAGRGRRTPSSSARRGPVAGLGWRFAFGGGLMPILRGACRFHELFLTRFRHARPRRGGSCKERPQRVRPERLPPAARCLPAPRARPLTSPPVTPRGPLFPTRRGGAALTLALLDSPPSTDGAAATSRAPPWTTLHRTYRPRVSLRPARCRRLTMPTRGALYNAGAGATSQQNAGLLAALPRHSVLRQSPIGHVGARTLDPGGLCPRFGTRASLPPYGGSRGQTGLPCSPNVWRPEPYLGRAIRHGPSAL